jgi:prepilin-type processing-associated H-X9-DG protein
VESLIVAAILALLATIIAPFLSRARERARGTVCLSNLRSIGELVQAFANSSDDCPAPTLWRLDTFWDCDPPLGWDIQTGTTLSVPGGAKSVWVCPAGQRIYVGNARALGVDRRFAFPNGEIHRVRRSRWTETAKLVLAYDFQTNVDQGWPQALDPRVGDLSDEPHAWPLSEPFNVTLWMWQFGPHAGAYAALFADGHAVIDRWDQENKALLWSGPRWWPDYFRPPEPGHDPVRCP